MRIREAMTGPMNAYWEQEAKAETEEDLNQALDALRAAFYECTSHINSRERCATLSASEILHAMGGLKICPHIQGSAANLQREDIRVKPYAESLGFDAFAAARPEFVERMGYPSISYVFEKGSIHIWSSADGVRAADLLDEGAGERFSNHRTYPSFFAALTSEAHLDLEEGKQRYLECVKTLEAGKSSPRSGVRP